MEIITNYLTKNDCYKSGVYLNVKGIMLHSVGCNASKVENFLSWNRSGLSACVHGFIDDEKTMITLPCWEEPGRIMKGWHSGSGYLGYSQNANNTGYLGFEMCEFSKLSYKGGATFEVDEKYKSEAIEYTKKVTANAVELFAQLCKFHNLDPLTQITSHYEGYSNGIASNHADPRHLWKQLNMEKDGYTMDNFRLWVKNRLDELNNEDDEDMTQEKFNELMNNYLSELAKKDPASWSANERLWAESNKIIKGDENGDMKYKSYCTREDMVVFLKRLYDLTK